MNETEKSFPPHPRHEEASKTSVVRMGAAPLVRQWTGPVWPVQFRGHVQEVRLVRVVIVYESLFGNTHEVAEAIQDGIRSAMPHAQVSCLLAAEATRDAALGADLLVGGVPARTIRALATDLPDSRPVVLDADALRLEVEPGR